MTGQEVTRKKVSQEFPVMAARLFRGQNFTSFEFSLAYVCGEYQLQYYMIIVLRYVCKVPSLPSYFSILEIKFQLVQL